MMYRITDRLEEFWILHFGLWRDLGHFESCYGLWKKQTARFIFQGMAEWVTWILQHSPLWQRPWISLNMQDLWGIFVKFSIPCTLGGNVNGTRWASWGHGHFISSKRPCGRTEVTAASGKVPMPETKVWQF